MAVLGKKRRNRHDDALDAADHARIRSHRAGAGGRRRAGKNHTRAGRSFGRSAERSVFASPGNGYCAAKLPVVGDYFTHLSLLFAANQGEARSRPSRRVYPGNSRVRTACPYPIGSAARKLRAIQSSALQARAAHGHAQIARHRRLSRVLARSPGPPAHPPAPATPHPGIHPGRSASPAQSRGSAWVSVPPIRRSSTRPSRHL